jgi:hypothetical protein
MSALSLVSDLAHEETRDPVILKTLQATAWRAAIARIRAKANAEA